MTAHRGLRRAAPALIACAALAASLTACSSGGDTPSDATAPVTGFTEPSSPVTITYAGAAYSAEQIQPVLDAFHAAHPNITVNYQSVPFDDFNSVLAAQLTSAEDAIDVFDVDMPRTDAYEARGWLADLTQAFPDLKNSVDPGSLEAATVGDKLVAMPYQTSTNILYYNKKYLKAAGIDYPSADPAKRMTWEDVATDAAEARDAGAKWGLLFDQIDRYYQLEPLMISAGGGAGGTGEGNLTPDVANDGWVKALTWYGTLFADKLSPRGVAVAETPDMFASGQVAYYYGGPWWAAQFTGEKDLDFGIAPVPAFAGGEAATPTGGWSLGMNPNTPKTDAVLTFMKFFGIDDGGYAQYISALAVPPSNLQGAEKFYSSEVFTDPRMDGVVDLMKHELANTAVLRLQTVGYVEFEETLTRTFDDIINGAEVPTALQKASDELNSAWEKYR